jgi:NAD(P)H-dependent FMN reductase
MLQPYSFEGARGRVSKPKLLVIVTSTRPGRVGLPIGQWFTAAATGQDAFDVELVDLAELDLPMQNEPHHPRLRQYQHDHTRRWSALIDSAAALVWIMPEYNHGYTAPLKNAIDYLVHEWAWLTVGLVSYGGLSGGIRATQLIKPAMADLKMVVLAESVIIPFVTQLIKDGVFEPSESIERQAQAMLQEMARVEAALRPLRAASIASLASH